MGPQAQPQTGRIAHTENVFCNGCRSTHVPGQCPLKLAGVQKCNLCGIAHFGSPRSCPSLNSEVQLRLMLDALNSSKDSPADVATVKAILTKRLAEVARKKKKSQKDR